MKKLVAIIGTPISLSAGIVGCDPCGELESRCDNCSSSAESAACRTIADDNDKASCEAALDIYNCH